LLLPKYDERDFAIPGKTIAGTDVTLASHDRSTSPVGPKPTRQRQPPMALVDR